jgi:ParB-like chromosome segregation protein Spo0J
MGLLSKLSSRVDAAPIEWRKLAAIQVPKTRVRKQLGPLSPLIKSLTRYGILHPLIVDQRGRLVAGMRRLRAAEKSGLTKVPVRVIELTPEEAAQIEVEENVQRESLNAMKARGRVADVMRYREQLEAKAIASGKVLSLGGRKKIRKEAIARAGLNENQYKHAQKREKTAGEMPKLDHWGKDSVNRVRGIIKEAPKREQTKAEAVAALFPGGKVGNVVALLHNLRCAPQGVRDYIYEVASHAGELRNPGAVLKALGKGPPEMDGRIHKVAEAMNELGGTVTLGSRSETKEDKRWFAELKRVHTATSALYEELMERNSAEYTEYCNRLRTALGIDQQTEDAG